MNDSLFFLQEYMNSDIVEADVLNCIEMIKKKKVLEIHAFAITAPKDMNSRWSTYIKDDNGKRKKITAYSDNALYEKLYKYYFEDNAITLESLFPEWVQLRIEQGTAVRTIARNQNHWDKYYRTHKIVKMPIQKIDSETIEKFFYECIKKYSLTSKELGNMKFILTDIFKLAKKRNLISYNPNNDVEVKTLGCRPPKKHNDSSRVYFLDEKEKLFSQLKKELERNPDNTDVYAIYLLWVTGLRIGELVALKWSDIDNITAELHVHRTETRGIDELNHLTPCVVDHTKKKSISGDRFLPLSKYTLSLFETVSAINKRNGFKEGDYIFCDSNGRTNSRSIDHLLRRCCEKANIEVKSAHDIRRTVASEMYSKGVSVEIIKNFLGHSDIKTTYGYIIDNNSKNETRNIIFQSLNNMQVI